MWQSLGFAIQFIFGVIIKNEPYMYVKVLILLSLQIIGSIGLGYIHLKHKSLDSNQV